MRVIVIYESMYGNTHAVAEAIAAGLKDGNDVAVTPAAQVQRDLLDRADLVVVGGPTHIHGMSSWRTRKGAIEAARKAGSSLVTEAEADGPGLREWLVSLNVASGRAAAFDTRLDGPSVFTGRASKTIGRKLAALGFTIVAAPESFLVTKNNELVPGEADRARDWGRQLARDLAMHQAVPG